MIRGACGAAGLLVCLVTGCSAGVVGSGHVASENRPVNGVEAVELSGVGELTIVQGEPESLVVEAEDNILPRLESRVAGGTLELSEKGILMPRRPIRFKLTASHLKSVTSTGTGSVQADGWTNPGKLTIRLEGAGGVNLAHLDCATLKVALEGAGHVRVQGQAHAQEIELAGSADYSAPDFKTQAAHLTISGAGDAQVWAADELKVEISGAGSVKYYGQPKITREISGAGSLRSMGEKPQR